MIRLFRSGAHSQRSPLSYPALAPLFSKDLTFVDRAEEADAYVFSHMLDIQAASRGLIEDWRRRRVPVILLSEEPFWDTIWGRRPLDRVLYVDTAFGTLPAVQLTHATCDIFRFERIPYYLLTDHRFANAYGLRLGRGAARSAAAWAADFAARQVELTFLFERRPEPHHAVAWPDAEIFGLCSWRTELAEACRGRGVERLGASWQGGASRFSLTHWHLDKLVRLDRHCRILGAIENTHQPDYITEKFLDAFACGARPAYYAGPGHRIHDFGLPPESWINLYGQAPEDAAETLAQARQERPDPDLFRTALALLARRFDDSGAWLRERYRLRDAVLAALGAVLDSRPA